MRFPLHVPRRGYGPDPIQGLFEIGDDLVDAGDEDHLARAEEHGRRPVSGGVHVDDLSVQRQRVGTGQEDVRNEGAPLEIQALLLAEASPPGVEEGIVPGGGVAYIRTINTLEKLKGDNEDEEIGIAIIKRSLEEPLRQIVENAGLEGSVIVQRVREGKDDFGFNAHTEKFENLFKSGVIDPTKVTRVALENAASIAGMFLTTACVISDIKEDTPPPMMNPGMGGMGGMM